MKAVFLLLIIPLLQVSASTYAQRITLQEKNASIELVFKKIKKQSGYSFLYEDGVLNEAKKVNLSISNESLETTLDRLFAEQPLTFSIKGKTIVVQPKEKSVVDKIIDYFSAIDVRGKVLDENGQPLQGATVKVKGTAQGAMTDKEGEFFLKGVPEDAVIVIAYLGYKPLELKASGSMGVIKMELTTSELSEVTVSTGYWTTTKRLSTGSISKVTAKEIGNQPVTSPLLALQGRVAGLEISMPGNAAPGVAPTIRIRGTNSLRVFNKRGTNREDDGNYPLYVIDGVPVSSIPIGTFGGSDLIGDHGYDPISTINPNNIESIEILKDADATAIYGSRGANGVILITTKTNLHNTEQGKFELNIYKGLGGVSRRLEMLNTDQYLAMRREALKNDGSAISDNDADLKYWEQRRFTDWQDVLIGGNAQITDLQATLSGGNSNTTFRLGGGFHKETLVTPGDFGYSRGSAQFSLNHISKNQKFKLGVVLNYGIDNNFLFRDGNLVSESLTLPPNAPELYSADGTLNWEVHPVGGLLRNTWINPLSYLKRTLRTVNHNLVANKNLRYELASGLSIQASIGYSYLVGSERGKNPISASPPVLTSASPTTIGLGYFSNFRRASWIFEPKLTYSKSKGDHTLDIVIGTTFQKNHNDFTYINAQYTSDLLLNSLKGAKQIINESDDVTNYNYLSVYGRVGYNWQEKYLLNLTGRRDGSSRFGPNHQFGNFGALGAAWIFSEETIIKNKVPFLTFGKLRSSYGITGSDAVRDYGYYNLYEIVQGTYQDVNGFIPSALYNPDFFWESTRKFETAIELGVCNNKLNLEVSWYQNQSSNNLIDETLPTVTGFPVVLNNFDATVQNTGWEAVLRIEPVVSNQLRWNVSLNLSIPRNKLIRFEGIENSAYATSFKVGEPLSIQWLYVYKGVNSQTGLYEFEDITKDGVINDSDRQLVNARNKGYYGGFNNTFQYKRFELSLQFQYNQQTRAQYLSFLPGSVNVNQPVKVLDRWFTVGDKTSIQQFSRDAGEPYLGFIRFQQSSGNREDASFIRLKSLSLSYMFEPYLLKRIGLEQCRFFLQGQNLLTFTRYIGLDPETGSGLPPLRMVTAGIQIRL